MTWHSSENSVDKTDVEGWSEGLICNMLTICLVIISIECASNVLFEIVSIFFLEEQYEKTAQWDSNALFRVASLKRIHPIDQMSTLLVYISCKVCVLGWCFYVSRFKFYDSIWGLRGLYILIPIFFRNFLWPSVMWPWLVIHFFRNLPVLSMIFCHATVLWEHYISLLLDLHLRSSGAR